MNYINNRKLSFPSLQLVDLVKTSTPITTKPMNPIISKSPESLLDCTTHFPCNISEAAIAKSPYFVYMHIFPNFENYIGYTGDLATRWKTHLSASFDSYEPSFSTPFHKALRNSRSVKHLLLAICQSESDARHLEAAAINHYKPTLNVRTEQHQLISSFLGVDISTIDTLPTFQPRSGSINGSRVTSKSTKGVVIAKVIHDKGRKRLQVIDGFNEFAVGLMIHNSKEKREPYRVGTKLRIKIKEIRNCRGTDFLVADNSANIDIV